MPSAFLSVCQVAYFNIASMCCRLLDHHHSRTFHAHIYMHEQLLAYLCFTCLIISKLARTCKVQVCNAPHACSIDHRCFKSHSCQPSGVPAAVWGVAAVSMDTVWSPALSEEGPAHSRWVWCVCSTQTVGEHCVKGPQAP